MLTPKRLPPMEGTQEGTVKDSLLAALTTLFSALTSREIMPLRRLITPLTALFRNSRMPSQAVFQLPEKVPARNVDRP